jgi:hypothetical protein
MEELIRTTMYVGLASKVNDKTFGKKKKKCKKKVF